MTYETDAQRYERLAQVADNMRYPKLADYFRCLANGTAKPVSLQPAYDPTQPYLTPQPCPSKSEAKRRRKAKMAFDAECRRLEKEYYDYALSNAGVDDDLVYEITEAGIAYLEGRKCP